MDFDNINPYTALIYFISVIFFGMIFMHPAFIIANTVFSSLSCIIICKKEFVKSLKYTLLFSFRIVFLNPLFNSRGNTVLFTIFSRIYTLEALIYGFILAGIFVSSINWFSCFGKIIQTDKFMYIFKGYAPSLCSLLSMILGLIPFFQAKLVEITQTQKVIIHNGQDKFKTYFSSFNAAVSYAFEHAIMMSFAMKNRGFGVTKPTHYKQYPFRKTDGIIILSICILFFTLFRTTLAFASNITIYPEIKLSVFTGRTIVGFLSYLILLSLPLIYYFVMEIKWKHLISEI